MATFLPNWFLISPSLNASGHSSLMIEKSCLIPIFALYSSSAWCCGLESGLGNFWGSAGFTRGFQWLEDRRDSRV